MKTEKSLEAVLYRLGWIGVLCFLPVYAFYRWVWIPKIHLPCALDFLFGVYCPGCGGTRALAALFRGEILLSLWYHPLVLYTVVIGGGFLLTQTLQRVQEAYLRRRERSGWGGQSTGEFLIRGWKFHEWYLYGALALLFGNWILKNVLRLCFQICM